MKNELFMAVDLGTSLIKVAAYNLEHRCIAKATAPVRDERPQAGVFIQRGEFIMESVMDCFIQVGKTLGAATSDVKGIAFTGQMAGSIGVDENFDDVTTFSCSLDTRYLPYAAQIREKLADKMYDISGTSSPVMCSKYLWFKNEFPEEHKRIAKYVMLNGYVIGQLAKLKASEAKIDYSLITWTGLADVKKLRWSEEICRALEIDMDILPEIVPSATIGGYLHEDVANKIGFPAGIPLVVGAGDKVAGCVGAAVLNEGDTMFEAGSYGAVCCNTREFRLDHEKKNYDIIGFIDDQFYEPHKYIQGSGIVIDWFIQTFIKEEGCDIKEAYKKAENLAKDVGPGSDRLMCLGLLSGNSIPFDQELHGMWIGHTLNHHMGHFYHSLLESFSYELKLTLDSLNENYPEYADRPIKLIGGGAKSGIWPQMLADVTGKTFVKLQKDDVALWGAALIAAKGTGAIDDVYDKAKQYVTVAETYVPDPDKHDSYKPYVRFYEELKTDMHDRFKRLNAIGGEKDK